MKFRSLTVTLAIAFLGVCTLVLTVFSVLDVYFDVQTQKTAIADRQQRIAQSAANTVRSFVQEKLQLLRATVRLSNLAQVHPEQQKLVLERLLGTEKAFRCLKLFEKKTELISVSRLSKSTPLRVPDTIARDTFTQVGPGKTYVSPVYVDEVTSEPMVIMAVSVTDIFGDNQGTLMAETNLKFMWDLVGQIRVGTEGLAYVVDNQGNLIASGDVSRVLRGENLIHLKAVNRFIGGANVLEDGTFNISRGIHETYVVSTYAPLATPDWAVVIELPVLEAYGPIARQLGISLLIMLLVLVIAIFAGNYLAKRIAKPIMNLRDATRKISRGDFSARTMIESEDEIGDLALSFNEMTKNLQETTTSIANLKREVSERKRMEAARRESEERYRIQFEEALDAIFIADAETGILLDCNQAGAELVGREKSELVGKHQQILHPQEQGEGDFSRTFKQHLKEKQGQALEAQVITKDGEIRDVAIKANMLQFKGRRVLQGIFRDTTDQKLMEKKRRELEVQIQRAERMETVGTLAGGVAHNFNNLLMTILGNVSLMLFDIDSAHTHYELLTEIKTQVKDGTRLAAQLLGYARKGQYYIQSVDLNDLVSKVSRSFGSARREVSIRTELAEGLSSIKADRSQIEQVLLNLLINGADAMPSGGDLVLKTANVTDEGIGGKLYAPRPGNYVQLTVTDTGKGMDKETMERIFEPFFTTKGLASGTGLGLASVYGIIKGHGGYIEVDSAPEHGSTFTVYLPATNKGLEEAVELQEEITKGTETLLLVDDEDRILTTAKRLLERLGYTVMEASSGTEALDVYKKNNDTIGMVILDIVMPRMGGGEVYDRMKEINPDVKVLLSSGYDIDKQAKEILARGCDAFIQKPFDLQELSQKIREVLDKK